MNIDKNELYKKINDLLKDLEMLALDGEDAAKDKKSLFNWAVTFVLSSGIVNVKKMRETFAELERLKKDLRLSYDECNKQSR